MDKITRRFIISFVITSLLGVFFHFLYDTSNQSTLIGVFTPINESIFEHLKLLFFPFILVSILELLISKKSITNIMPYRIFYITFSIILLPLIYYTAKKIGINNAVFNITLYFICLEITYLLSYEAEKKQLIPNKKIKLLSLGIFTLLIILFVAMTFNPPHIEIFKDPINGTYGI